GPGATLERGAPAGDIRELRRRRGRELHVGLAWGDVSLGRRTCRERRSCCSLGCRGGGRAVGVSLGGGGGGAAPRRRSGRGGGGRGGVGGGGGWGRRTGGGGRVYVAGGARRGAVHRVWGRLFSLCFPRVVLPLEPQDEATVPAGSYVLAPEDDPPAPWMPRAR